MDQHHYLTQLSKHFWDLLDAGIIHWSWVLFLWFLKDTFCARKLTSSADSIGTLVESGPGRQAGQ